MSKSVERVEVTTGRERRRRYSAEEKVRLVEETARPGMTVSAVARLHGVSPSLLFGWRRRMAKVASKRSEPTRTWSRPAASANSRRRSASWSACSAARRWRPRSSARRWNRPAPKNSPCACPRRHRPVPGEGRGRHPRRGPVEPGGPASASRAAPTRPLPPGRGRPAPGRHPRRHRRAAATYGYRRVAALLNRARRASGDAPVNRKRVLRLMQQALLTLQPHTGRRPIRAHEGTVVALASNRRWASDGFEIPCWTARSSASPSPSTPTTARSWPGSPPRARASAARWSAT